jgi:hypothetical protein
VLGEAGLAAASAKFGDRLITAPDAGWQAIVTNPGPPAVGVGADLPANPMVGRSARDEIAVAGTREKWPGNRVDTPGDVKWLALVSNSAPPPIDARTAVPTNAIAELPGMVSEVIAHTGSQVHR